MTIQPLATASAAGALALDPDVQLPGGVQDLLAWSGGLRVAVDVAQQLVDTPFLPVSYWPLPTGMSLRDFPGQNPALQHPREDETSFARRREIACAAAAAAMLYGGQIGFDPLVAWASIYVVRGKPGLYAEAMEALAKQAGHEIELLELTDRVCRMRGRRKGAERWQEFEFTIERAERAGYAKQNPKYGSDPQSMLHARCRSITARAIAPDVMKGLRAVEDILDEAPETEQGGSRPVTVADVGRVQAAVGPPPTAGSPAPEPPPEPELHPLDESQWRKINARLHEIGVSGTGRDVARMQVMSRIVGRPIERGGELTRDEGQLIIDNLASEPGIDIVWSVLGDIPEPFAFAGEIGARLQARNRAAAFLRPEDAPDVDPEAQLPEPADGGEQGAHTGAEGARDAAGQPPEVAAPPADPAAPDGDDPNPHWGPQ